MLDRYGEPLDEPAFDAFAVAQCEFCDDSGIRLNGLGRCDHRDHAAAARRGMALIRAALQKGKQ